MGRAEAAGTPLVVAAGMEQRQKLGHDPGLQSKIWEEMLVFGLVEQVTALQAVLRKSLRQACLWGGGEKETWEGSSVGSKEEK